MIDKLQYRRVLVIIVGMAFISILLSVIILFYLYNLFLECQKTQLLSNVKRQKFIINSIAKFDKVYCNDYPGGWYQGTISQVKNAYLNCKGIGQRGEVLLGKNVDGSIQYILSCFNKDKNQQLNIKLAKWKPMYLALNGKSGVLVETDYKGSKVLAAYCPVNELKAGIVITMKMSEILEPFYRIALITLITVISIISFGVLLYSYIGLKFIKSLQNKNEILSNKDKELSSLTLKLDESHHKERESKVEAELCNRAKIEFLANMSHEFRTPLNSIIGFSDALSQKFFGELNDKQNEYVDNILFSSRHLLKLVNELLEYSKFESTAITLNLDSVNIIDVLNDAIKIVEVEANNKNITFNIHSNTAQDLLVKFDRIKINQVFVNILVNAIKFSNTNDPIDITVDSIENSKFRISFKDYGIGIEEVDSNKVFEPFVQLDDSISRKFSGAGLGMSISRKLIIAHGGRIWFESKGKGKGVTFIVELPNISENISYIERRTAKQERRFLKYGRRKGDNA